MLELLPVWCAENDQSGVETVLVLLETLLDLNVLVSADFVGSKQEASKNEGEGTKMADAENPNIF